MDTAREDLEFQDREVHGYVPSTGERFQIGSHIAGLMTGLRRFACLANREQIDPENFTARVAANRGPAAPVFNDREKAVDWILQDPAPPAR